jgi:hypothetical protein
VDFVKEFEGDGFGNADVDMGIRAC